MVKLNKYRVVFALALLILLAVLVVSACNINIGIGGTPTPPPPVASGILAPANQTKTLVDSPVQVQSAHLEGNISRVELYVQGPNEVGEKLLRADVPDSNGVVLQEWIPELPGLYTIRTVAFTVQNERLERQPIQVEVLDSTAISLATPEIQPQAGEESVAFQAPTATPTVTPVVIVQVVTPESLTPTPTPPLHYPPPPAIPGVPEGPTQEELPEKMPPVCDAAEYLGVFTADTGRRIFIPTEDQVAAKVVAGSTVHRAWRVRNIGTCTWGPGYELAFYGGRAMGSGGIAFEAAYPADPGRRNALVSNERLIVPEGKPNQTSILELLLNIPSTPGIHQSYWRMRNPQGVYFGPIIGVTLEVVRDCRPEEGGPRIYGAPVINRFEVLGVGNVYEPDIPKDVLAEHGDTITLDWDVINATSFDVVLENPLGQISALSNTATRGRAQFIAGELGTYRVTLYADNGACAYTDEVTITVVPGAEDLFELDIILAPSSAAANVSNENIRASETLRQGDIVAEWRHFDTAANQFTLIAELYHKESRRECVTIFGWRLPYCPVVETWVPAGVRGTSVDVGAEAEGAATVTNLETSLCSGRTPPEDYGIRYIMRAQKNGRPATPEYSNPVDVICGGVRTPSDGGRLPTEIQSQEFSP